jgi:nitrite reductase (NADH) small subunit
MTDYHWTRVTEAGNIPLREGRAVQLGPLDVAIFNVDGRFLAIDNRCPHSGGPLCDGIVSGRSVVCPLHAWKISLEDGTVQRPSGAGTPPVATYPVRVEDGIVVVGIERRVVRSAAARVQAAEGLPA